MAPRQSRRAKKAESEAVPAEVVSKKVPEATVPVPDEANLAALHQHLIGPAGYLVVDLEHEVHISGVTYPAGRAVKVPGDSWHLVKYALMKE